VHIGEKQDAVSAREKLSFYYKAEMIATTARGKIVKNCKIVKKY
jgi:hypothetical protein